MYTVVQPSPPSNHRTLHLAKLKLFLLNNFPRPLPAALAPTLRLSVSMNVPVLGPHRRGLSPVSLSILFTWTVRCSSFPRGNGVPSGGGPAVCPLLWGDTVVASPPGRRWLPLPLAQHPRAQPTSRWRFSKLQGRGLRTRRSSHLPFASGGPCRRRGSPATDTLPVAAPHPQGLWAWPQKASQIKQERLPTPSPGASYPIPT